MSWPHLKTTRSATSGDFGIIRKRRPQKYSKNRTTSPFLHTSLLPSVRTSFMDDPFRNKPQLMLSRVWLLTLGMVANPTTDISGDGSGLRLPCRIWSPSVKRYKRTCGDPPEKLAPRIPPFKFTQGHRNRNGSTGSMTSYYGSTVPFPRCSEHRRRSRGGGAVAPAQWRRNRGFRRFNEPGPRAPGAQSDWATEKF